MTSFDESVFHVIRQRVDGIEGFLQRDQELRAGLLRLLDLHVAWQATLDRRRQALERVAAMWNEALASIESRFDELLEATLVGAAERLATVREELGERVEATMELASERAEQFVESTTERLDEHDTAVDECLQEGLPAGLQDAQAAIAAGVDAVAGIVERAEFVLEAAGGEAAKKAAELERLISAVRPVLDVIRTLS